MINPDGSVIENNGVMPDIYADMSEVVEQRYGPAIEFGFKLLENSKNIKKWMTKTKENPLDWSEVELSSGISCFDILDLKPFVKKVRRIAKK
jgi:hypothetical protein